VESPNNSPKKSEQPKTDFLKTEKNQFKKTNFWKKPKMA
jgi:hypothetical protein